MFIFASCVKKQQTDQIADRLVEQIDPEALFPQRGQQRDPVLHGLLPERMAQEDPIHEPAAEIQKEPGKNRKVISRIKARERKAQRRKYFYVIQNVRDTEARTGAEADKSRREIPEKQEQQETDDQTGIRRYFFCGRTQGDHQQDGAAQKIEDTEPDDFRREGKERDRCNQKTAEIDEYAAPERVFSSPGPDKA